MFHLVKINGDERFKSKLSQSVATETTMLSRIVKHFDGDQRGSHPLMTTRTSLH